MSLTESLSDLIPALKGTGRRRATDKVEELRDENRRLLARIVGVDDAFALLHEELADTRSKQGDMISLDTKMLARWKHADTHLRVWQTAPEKPLLLVGDDFLGLQMPARYRGDAKDRAAVLSDWSGSLGQGGERTETPAPLPEPGAVAEMAKGMLHRTLQSTAEMFDADTDTEKGRAAFIAWVHSGSYAWSAYRLLQALKKADPDLAEATVRDLNEQLESGEIGEWAWDEAKAAGHNPQAWHDDYEAHLKKLAEKRAAKSADTTA